MSNRYPYFGVPPARQPRPAAHEPALRGKRVVLSTPEGFVYDVRAATEVYTEASEAFVDVVAEEDWYRWILTGVAPSKERYPLHLVWLD